MDPTRGDMVAGLGDVTSVLVIKQLKKRMLSTEAGRDLLRRKPLVSSESLNLPALRQLPDGTLGKGYVTYMDSHGFSPDERTIVRFMDDPDLAYIMTRYRQVHDYWHVLTALPPSELGEIAQKAFEWRVTGLPVGLISTVFGPLRLSPSDRRRLCEVYLPWALRAGGAVGDLLTFDYEGHLATPIVEVKKMLNFETPPPLEFDRK